MTAAERAESHLRLMAEAELRRAVAYPSYEPPEPSGAPGAVRSAVRLSRPALAPLLPPLRSAARVSGPLLASLWPAARTAASAAWQSPAGRVAEPVLWRALRARHAVQPLRPGRDRFPQPPAEVGLQRVRLVASALVAADAISEPRAQTVIEGLADALAIRGKLSGNRLHRPPSPRWWGPGSPWQPGSPPPPLPAGPVQTVLIGTALPQEPGGNQGETSLLTVVLAPGRAVIIAAWSPSRTGTTSRRPWQRSLPPRPFGQLTAVDDHGTRYQADPDPRAVSERWSLAFDLTPVPPPAARWLDITGDGVPDPIRVGLSGAASAGDSPRPDPAGLEPADSGQDDRAGLPSRGSLADRPLDALAERVLADVTQGYGTGDVPLRDLTEIAPALQAATGLTAGSAALGRLAALADRLGIRFPPSLRPLAPPARLPDAWLNVLEHRGAADGPDRVAAVTAVLPEVDGARFALAGLDSVADSATLRVVAWGWQPSPLTSLGDRFSWWARDDRGRWHFAQGDGANSGGGQMDLFVEFGPALHPDARSLELFVRGPAGQAAVTLPLHWLGSR